MYSQKGSDKMDKIKRYQRSLSATESPINKEE